jgi:hypothetical protein
MKLGFDCTLIEREPKYVADIRHRIKRWSGLDMPLFTPPPSAPADDPAARTPPNRPSSAV